MIQPLAVTGIGFVDACGFNVNDLVGDLAAGRGRFQPLSREQARDEPRAYARCVDDSQLLARLARGTARRMSRPSRFAVSAALDALATAGLDDASGGDGPTSVAIATTFGPLANTEKLLDQMRNEGPTAASPALFTECVANAPAAQVSIATGATGANIAVCQREVGPLAAIGIGLGEMAAGRAERVLLGSTDEVTMVQHRVLSRFGALSGTAAGGEPHPQPFGLNRDGFLLAEGATVLLCERPDAARRRDAEILATILAAGAAFDPSASRAGWGTGAADLAGALSRWLERSGVERDSIDLIVSGASGSIAGDRLEGRMLRHAWRDQALPPVITPKAVTGEYGGGFLAAAMLAAQGQGLAQRTAHEVDPEIGVAPEIEGRPNVVGRVLVTCCAAGGAAAWVVMEAA